MSKSKVKFGLNLENLLGLKNEDLFDKEGDKEQIVGTDKWKKQIKTKTVFGDENDEWDD